jgi:hypothetical protein
MRAALLDVNVLIALFDPGHPNHEDAHRWFSRNRKQGWATCAVTINGCIRVLSSPSYPADETLFRPEAIAGHRQVTDVYLLGLAIRRGGRLATFDRSIPLKAVRGARAECMEVLGGGAD